MTVNNRDSLRAQLIAAMEGRFGKQLAESVFQCDIWPVLEASMNAGELLVHRATIPQRPVDECIVSWLTQCVAIVETMVSKESTISKGHAMRILKQLAVSAQEALADSKIVNTK